MYDIAHRCMSFKIDISQTKLICYFPICIITHNNNLFNKTLMYSRSKIPIDTVIYSQNFVQQKKNYCLYTSSISLGPNIFLAVDEAFQSNFL